MYFITSMVMIRKFIERLTVRINVSQYSILFSMLYKRGCLRENLILRKKKLTQW